jgi:5-methylcytosine-specific restriction enzyme A
VGVGEGAKLLDDWDEYVKSRRESEVRFIRPMIEASVRDTLRELRRDFHGHNLSLNIEVLIPVCSTCTRPEYIGESWRDFYIHCLGMGWRDVLRTARAVKSGDWQLRCHRCHNEIVLDQGDEFRVQHETLSEFFSLWSAEGKKTPSAMKQLVIDVFGQRCAACQKDLYESELTMDHIVAVSQGGRTEMLNLQPLCRACNATKADSVVEEIGISLDFLFRPPPSDAFEGVIW